jgi:hypothetical protein
LSRINCKSKIVDHVLFLNKVWGGWVGWGGGAKSGSKAFSDYFVVSRRQKYGCGWVYDKSTISHT